MDDHGVGGEDYGISVVRGDVARLGAGQSASEALGTGVANPLFVDRGGHDLELEPERRQEFTAARRGRSKNEPQGRSRRFATSSMW
jgi:hypothetical protein